MSILLVPALQRQVSEQLAEAREKGQQEMREDDRLS